MRSFLARILGNGLQGPDPVRDRGRPPSGNGASSLHLVWEDGSRPWRAVRATLEVASQPGTNDLYFFAVQATFASAGRHLGGAHVGLQWNQRHPGNTAVNWGGYHSQERGGAILDGTDSALPSRPADPNTRDYSWRSRTPYRLTIGPGREPGWWLGTVEDLASRTVTEIRELHGGGEALIAPMVWAEVFAPCDGPAISIHWTDLEVAPALGEWRTIDAVRVNYQSFQQGGCTNTTAKASGGGWIQETNTARQSPQGTVLVAKR